MLGILAIIDLNFTDFINTGVFRIALGPYLDIFGNLFWGIIFGFIGGGIYANERSVGTTATYLILVAAFTGFIFPASVVAIFGLLLAFLIAVILYYAFVRTGE